MRQGDRNDRSHKRVRATGPPTSGLPIAQVKDRLIGEIKKHPTVIIVGETGSGKTTQIPQFLHDAGLTGQRQMLGCTQPRRVAAVTVARRVASEMNSRLGNVVGYSVRFDDKTSKSTRIKYLTDGMLLREAMADPRLGRYSVIILDEAHERTLHTDVLFALIKGIQQKRKNLKIIIMSATLEAESFSKYFSDCPILYVAGRQHPVKLMYTVEPQSDLIDSTLVTISQIHQEKPIPGDILVFLTGQDEIEAVEKLLKTALIAKPEGCAELKVCPLYGALSSEAQLQAFEPAPAGVRKVILSTNIAETSVTINGIRYVVDTGKVKQRVYNPRTGLDTLAVVPISQAQALQRCGRAGRESSGICYRLYQEAAFESLNQSTTPEILRGNLSTVVLQLLAIGIKNPLEFDFMDPPSSDALVDALQLLYELDAITDKFMLTEHGRKLSDFPLEPKLGQVVLESSKYGCGEEILSIIAMMSVENVFVSPPNKREEADAARVRFVVAGGDQMTLLNVWNEFKITNQGQEWCFRNFVNRRSMLTVVDTRKQLRDVCQRLELQLESSRGDSDAIRKSLLAGLFTNVAERSNDGDYKSLKTGQLALIHPSSTLFNSKCPVILYYEMTRTTKLYLRGNAELEPEWLSQVVPSYFQ